MFRKRHTQFHALVKFRNRIDFLVQNLYSNFNCWLTKSVSYTQKFRQQFGKSQALLCAPPNGAGYEIDEIEQIAGNGFTQGKFWWFLRFDLLIIIYLIIIFRLLKESWDSILTENLLYIGSNL